MPTGVRVYFFVSPAKFHDGTSTRPQPLPARNTVIHRAQFTLPSTLNLSVTNSKLLTQEYPANVAAFSLPIVSDVPNRDTCHKRY